MKKMFLLVVALGSSACTTSTSAIREKSAQIDVSSPNTADQLVTCITAGLQRFDREVKLEPRGTGTTIVVGVLDQPQYIIDIDDLGASRRVALKQRAMLFQGARQGLIDLIGKCA